MVSLSKTIVDFCKKVIRHIEWRFRHLLDVVLLVPRVLWCRFFYRLNVRRIREKLTIGQRVNVLFIVDAVAKWKSQTVYDALQSDGHYNPVIGIVRPDRCLGVKPAEVKNNFAECVSFFSRRQMDYVCLYDVARNRDVQPDPHDFDVVFYPQSWFFMRGLMPYDFARFALTCYIPYYVPNYGDISLDSRLPLHRFVFRHFVLNDGWRHLFERKNRYRMYAGKFLGIGHPMLDVIKPVRTKLQKQLVIYAPHWTIDTELTAGSRRYSTFTENGRAILQYAQRHTEIEWVFKPHPELKKILIESRFMTQEEVEAYYQAWATIGRCYDSAGYEELFNASSAMITDCGSFLTEYAITGNPIIHLISPDRKMMPSAPSLRLYATYYQARSLDEMYECFKVVLEERRDPFRSKRLAELEHANLLGSSAGVSIKHHFDEIFCIKESE